MRNAFEVVFVLLLIVANGVFSMSETAVVSARRARLQQRADEGDAGARSALADEPNIFLATVQVGITLIGILSGAFGGARLAGSLAGPLRAVPGIAPYADTIAFSVVVLAITYLSLVVGELVPKRIALNNPEGIASFIAGPMRGLSTLASPIVRLLSASTNAAFRLLRIRESEEPPVTDEEIGVLLEQGARAGVFEHAEREMVESVLDLADDRVTSLMTPRPDIVWLDLEAPAEENRRRMAGSVYSRFPLCRGNLDEIVGVIRAKDLLVGPLTGRALELEECACPPLLVPETTTALRVLEAFRQRGEHIALVVDEYGGIAGLVTTNDVLEAIVGYIPSVDEPDDPEVVCRPDGSWLLDGTLPVDRIEEVLKVAELPEEGAYQTLAGFVLAQLGRIPRAGEGFEWGGFRFEVADMDGNRVDKVIVTPLTPDATNHSITGP